MTSVGLKKKKRKAAKKKKKKNNNEAKKNKSINIHSPANVQGEEYANGCVSKELIQEGGCSSSTIVGLVSESQSMEGSGNGGTEPVAVIVEEKEEAVGAVKEVESEGDSVTRTVSIEDSGNGVSLADGDGDGASTSHEVVEKIESLEKEKEKEEDGNSIVEAVEEADSKVVGAENVEKVVSISEKVIPIVEEGIKKETEVKTMLSNVLEAIPIQKAKALDFVDLVSKENVDSMVSSLDEPRIETSHETKELKESELVEKSSRDQPEDAPVGQVTEQRTTWKSCCGLFDVLTGSNR